LRDLWDLLRKISDHRTKERSAQKDTKITKIQSASVINARRPSMVGLVFFSLKRYRGAAGEKLAIMLPHDKKRRRHLGC
jgi:hypothetical protein